MATNPLMLCFQIMALVLFLNIEGVLSSNNSTNAPPIPTTSFIATTTTSDKTLAIDATPTVAFKPTTTVSVSIPAGENTTPNPTSTPGGLSTITIIGIAVGATLGPILVVVLTIVVCKCVCKKSRRVAVRTENSAPKEEHEKNQDENT